MPLLCLTTIALVIAIAATEAAAPAPAIAVLIAAILGLAALGLLRVGRPVWSACLVFAVAGVLLGASARERAAPGGALARVLDGRQPADVEGVVAGPEEAVRGRVRLVVEVERAGYGGRLQAASGRLLLRIGGAWSSTPPPSGSSAGLLPGDGLRFRARVRRPRGFATPGAFDTERHLAAARIGAVATVSEACDVVRLATPPRPSVLRTTARLHRRLADLLTAHTSGQPRAILLALLLGDRGELDQPLEESFRRAGVTHVLSVSGLHLAIAIFLFYVGLRRLLLRLPGLALRIEIHRLAAALSIPAAWGYTLLTGAALATVRSALMASMILAAVVLGRRACAGTAIAVAATAILLYSPLALFEPSFQLTFSAVLGLRLIPLPESLFPGARPLTTNPAPSRLGSLPARAVRGVVSLVAASLGAILATAPIVAHHFHELSLAGVAGNLVVVPLCEWLLLPAGLAALALCGLVPALASVLLPCVELIARLTIFCVEGLACFAPVIPLSTPGPAEIVAFYLLLWLVCRWRRFGPGSAAAARFGFLPALRRPLAASAAGLWLLAALAPHAFSRLDSRLRVTVLDVGQGDAILVELPHGGALLVDGGPAVAGALDTGQRVIEPLLRQRRIRHLDALVLTHAHDDHAGGLGHIIKRFSVGELWVPAECSGSPLCAELLRLADRRRVLTRQPVSRVLFGVAIDVLHPPASELRSGIASGMASGMASDRELNDTSLVLAISYGGRRVLLTGDAEQPTEEDLLARGANAGADVLKVAHHGSRRATSTAFLEAVRPSVAMLSLAAGNRFNFPHPETMERLRDAGAEAFRTDQDGALTLTLSRDGALSVETHLGRRRLRLRPGQQPVPSGARAARAGVAPACMAARPKSVLGSLSPQGADMRPTLIGVATAVGTATTNIHCGPTAEEAGQVVLLLTPAVVLASLGLQYLLVLLWRRRFPDVHLSWKRGLVLVGVLLVPAVMVLALAERPFEYADIGFWLFGCSYAALLLVSTRLWLLWRQRTDLVFAHLPPLLLQFVPALALALGANAALHIPSAENLFIYPGFGGWVAAPLAGALFLEAWLRTRRRTAAAASLALPCSAMAGGENPSERAPSREGAE